MPSVAKKIHRMQIRFELTQATYALFIFLFKFLRIYRVCDVYFIFLFLLLFVSASLIFSLACKQRHLFFLLNTYTLFFSTLFFDLLLFMLLFFSVDFDWSLYLLFKCMIIKQILLNIILIIRQLFVLIIDIQIVKRTT